MKLTKAMAACLKYYGDNEHNPNRLQRPPYKFNMRQVNSALDKDFLKVGSGGWHVLSDAGRSALRDGGGE
jgi:hypothetical protein